MIAKSNNSLPYPQIPSRFMRQLQFIITSCYIFVLLCTVPANAKYHTTSAFSFCSGTHNIGVINKNRSILCRAYKHNSLKMSSTNNDDKIETTNSRTKNKTTSWRNILPPSPEDQIILSGDIIALFVYAFMDHIATSAFSEENTIASYISSSTSFLVPVWSDTSLHNAGASLIHAVMTEQQQAHITSTILDATPTHYAPCLSTAGISAILLASCWLVSGYFNNAFAFKNTIMCAPDRALIVTGRTWIVAAAMMVVLALLSDNVFCGCNKLGSLSQADAAFIFDSLSVLATWRFVVASMLNGRW